MHLALDFHVFVAVAVMLMVCGCHDCGRPMCNTDTGHWKCTYTRNFEYNGTSQCNMHTEKTHLLHMTGHNPYNHICFERCNEQIITTNEVIILFKCYISAFPQASMLKTVGKYIVHNLTFYISCSSPMQNIHSITVKKLHTC